MGLEFSVRRKVGNSGNRFGLNISVPLKDGGAVTLAPISGYANAADPGKINFVMAVIGK